MDAGGIHEYAAFGSGGSRSGRIPLCSGRFRRHLPFKYRYMLVKEQIIVLLRPA